MTPRQLERMLSRASVVRAYYSLREKADLAAVEASDARSAGDTESAEFHTGRHCGMLSALTILDSVLSE